MNIINYIENKIQTYSPRSKWNQGVKEYAEELIEQIQDGIKSGYIDIEEIESPRLLSRILLNGADSWHQYSWCGCSLIYNQDICERLATASEQRRTKNGWNPPNNREEWLDTQARALWQAHRLIDRFCEEWLKSNKTE